MNGEVLTPGTNRAADAPPRLNIHARGFWELQGQWRIQGRGPGGPRPPPYFSTKMRPEGRKKNFLETAPPYLRVWMTDTPPDKVWIRH